MIFAMQVDVHSYTLFHLPIYPLCSILPALQHFTVDNDALNGLCQTSIGPLRGPICGDSTTPPLQSSGKTTSMHYFPIQINWREE